MTPVERIVERLLEGARRQTDGSFMCRCPAHEDRHASLHVSEAEDGKALLICHAGCDPSAVLGKIGLALKDLFPEKAPRPAKRSASKKSREVAVYDYLDEQGRLVHQTVRYEPKRFLQRHAGPDGRPIWNLEGVETRLYHLAEVLAAARSRGGVIVCEGEKDADSVKRLGFVTTTNAMGAGPGKWLSSYSDALAGAHVVILPHKDGAAKKHAGELFGEERARALQGKAASVRVIHLPGPGKDATDWIEAGGTAEELRRLIREAPPWREGWWTPATPAPAAPKPAVWPAISPLGSGRLPEFPLDTLPDRLRRFVEQEAVSIQVPASAIVLVVLAVCATAVARKIRVEIGPDYDEPLNLYTVVVLPPGERKSEALKRAAAPLGEWERDAIRRARADIEEHRTKKEILEARARAAKMKAAKASEEDAAQAGHNAARIAREASDVRVPPTPKLYTNNVTAEALTSLLEQHGGRMAVFAAEGGVFGIMAGHYSRGSPNFEVFLCGHSGDEIKVDRKTRASETILRPALTMAVAIQPDVLESFSSQPSFRGRGLLARFLYAIPVSLMGERDVEPPAVEPGVRELYHDTVRRLLEIPEGEMDPSGDRRERLMRFDAGGRKVFTVFRREVEAKLRPFAELGAMTDWGGKLSGSIGRIAALFHLVENCESGRPWEIPIEALTAARATATTDFFIAHAAAAFAGMQVDPKLSDAQLVLRWIRSERRERFTARELHQALRGRARFRLAEALEEPLALLARHSYIRRVNSEDSEKRGPGRKSVNYLLHPMIYEIEDFEGHPINPSTEERVDQGSTGPAPHILSMNGPQNTQNGKSLSSKEFVDYSLAMQPPQHSRDPGEEG